MNYAPYFRLLAYPLTAQTVTQFSGFALCDDLRRMPRAANIPQYGPLPPTVVDGILLQEPASVAMPSAVEKAHGLRYWHLEDEQDGTVVSGFTLQDHTVPVNSLIDYSVAPDPQYHVMRWGTGSTPRADLWTSSIPDYTPEGVSGLAWHSADPQEPYNAVTLKPLPANQCFRTQLNLLGAGPKATNAALAPAWQMIWGGEWTLRMEAGKPPILARWMTRPGETRPGWVGVKIAEQFGKSLLTGEPIDIGVYNLAGRVVVTLETSSNRAQMVYTQRGTDKTAGMTGDARACTWKQAPLKVQGLGVPFTARFSEVQWGAWDADAGAASGSGYFTRVYNCNRKVLSGGPLQASAFGYHPNGAATREVGSKGPDPTALATISDAAAEKAGQRRYTCELNGLNPGLERERKRQAATETITEGFAAVPGPDGNDWTGYHQIAKTAMWGSQTPLVHSVALRLSHTTTTTSYNPIDLRPAVLRASERVADPELQPGAAWTVEVSRPLLPDCPICDPDGVPTGETAGDDWDQYANKYHPCTVDVGWYDETGTLGPVYRRLIGYIMSKSEDLLGYGQWPGRLELNDCLVRLQPPAGLIDGGFAPLDLLAAELQKNGRQQDWSLGLADTLYGVDAIDYVLRCTLGPDVADDLLVYFDNNYRNVPIIKRDALFNPPNGSGFRWPPPFGDHALNWIKQIAQADFAVFCAGQIINDQGAIRFAPVYGNYFEIVRNMPTVEIPDTVYAVGDADKLLQQAQLRQEAHADYNRVLTWGRPPQANVDLGGLMPTLPGYSSEARIQTGSAVPEQDIAKTWARTLLIQNPYIFTPQMATTVAAAVCRWLKDVDRRHIGLTCRGLPQLWWGWKVTPKMQGAASDTELGLDGKTLRVMRIENDYDLENNDWKTKMAVVDNPTARR